MPNMSEDDLKQYSRELNELDKEPLPASLTDVSPEIALKPQQLSSVTEQPQLSQKGSKAKFVAIIVGSSQIILVGMIALIILSAVVMQQSGMSGMEFIVLAAIVFLYPLVAIMAVVNVITICVYFIGRKPHSIAILLPILSLLVSFAIIGYVGYIQYSWYGPAKPNEELQKLDREEKKRLYENRSVEITVPEAKQMLTSCKVSFFTYTAQTDRDNKMWGELSTTGVVLSYQDNKPRDMSIADRLVPELLPIALEARKQKTCGLRTWHDGYEDEAQADGTYRWPAAQAVTN
jgi:hypothetical protein